MNHFGHACLMQASPAMDLSPANVRRVVLSSVRFLMLLLVQNFLRVGCQILKFGLTLDVHLSYLDSTKRSDITELIHKHPALFSDVPTCTNDLQHDVDVGDAALIKQHPYRANPLT